MAASETFTSRTDAAGAARGPFPPQVLDAKTHADLRDLMGHELVERLLDRLFVQSEACLQAPDLTAEGLEGLARKAHALVSASGMLGFRELSEASRALERACRGDGDLACNLELFRSVRSRALQHVVQLKTAV